MQQPQQGETQLIEGPVGELEALLETPRDGAPDSVAVVCHPHPLHGGTMSNKVAHTLARAFLASNMATLRFNFRGVEKSAGEFDDGVGEVDDTLAALAWLADRYPGKSLWLAGFSFGASMAIRAAIRRPVAGVVSIAPAANRFAGDLTLQPDSPWLIVHGEDDEVVDVQETIDWVNALEPGPELIVFPETTHFFHGKLVDLRETVRSFVTRIAGDG